MLCSFYSGLEDHRNLLRSIFDLDALWEHHSCTVSKITTASEPPQSNCVLLFWPSGPPQPQCCVPRAAIKNVNITYFFFRLLLHDFCSIIYLLSNQIHAVVLPARRQFVVPRISHSIIKFIWSFINLLLLHFRTRGLHSEFCPLFLSPPHLHASSVLPIFRWVRTHSFVL